MEELLKFIIEEALVMVPVLLILGYTIKQTKWNPSIHCLFFIAMEMSDLLPGNN